MSKRKLLLADDSITIQKVVNLTFADEGIEVITAGDGNAAIERFSEFAPDLVLADVNMPGLNGYEVCEIIRKNEETKNVPVILLVGSFEPFDESEAKRVGANDFLTKPFQSIRQLVNKVNDLIGSNGGDEEFPPELESLGVQTQTAEPELDDIDSLYKESFADTVELPAQSQVSDKFTDPGMDDEMIETSFTNSSAIEEPFPPLDEPEYQQHVKPPEHSFSRYDESAFRAIEENLTEEDVKVEEQPLNSEQADFEKSFEEIKTELPQETSFREQEDQFAQRFNEHSLSPFDEEKEEETVFEAVSDAGRESKTQFPAFGQPVAPWSSFAESAPPQDQDVQQNFEAPISSELNEPTTARFEFDEVNLLELPQGQSTIAETPTPASENFKQAETLPDTTEISQETIDQIASKVADRVAEQVIREIAGRIPDIVDAAISKKMSEAANG